MSQLETDKQEVIRLANELHQMLCSIQNSGEVDEFYFSLIVADADDLRESILEFYETLDKH